MRIEIRDLNYAYNAGQADEMKALDGVSFVVEDGSFTGIIGHTGSGKSTLVQQMNGLLKPDSGQILIGDTDITVKGTPMTEIRRRVGLVFQYPEYQLFEETVAKDIAFGPGNLGLDEETVDARVREAMNLVGLSHEEMAERSPFELSGGQKRRVAIAGVLAMDPEVLILDEPAAGLDPKSHTDILEMIERIRREKGCTIILVSHNMDDVARYCDQVLVMDHGKLRLSGSPDQVFAEWELLEEIGLGLPSSRQLLREMSLLGAELTAEGVLTETQAAAKVFEYLKGNK